MEMKNNEWNVPSDYFEKNKKALMPVRKMSNRNWLLALAAACFVGIGLFMWKSEDQSQEIARVEQENEKQNENENENEGKIKNEKQNENENESLDKRGEEKVREGKMGENIGSKNLSTKEEIAEELKEIPREELVAYLLEEDSELIENLN
jgi:hypothetical protein